MLTTTPFITFTTTTGTWLLTPDLRRWIGLQLLTIQIVPVAVDAFKAAALMEYTRFTVMTEVGTKEHRTHIILRPTLLRLLN